MARNLVAGKSTGELSDNRFHNARHHEKVIVDFYRPVTALLHSEIPPENPNREELQYLRINEDNRTNNEAGDKLNKSTTEKLFSSF